MKYFDIVDKVVDFVALNYLGIFGLYSILFLVMRSIVKDKHQVNKFDTSAIELTLWIGTIWMILKIISISLMIYQLREESEWAVFVQHFSWFLKNIWLQLLTWILISQALRIQFIRDYLLPRILVSLLFVFSFDHIDMLINPDHPWYLLNEQYLGFELVYNTIGLFIKVLIFILLVGGFHFVKGKINEDNGGSNG